MNQLFISLVSVMMTYFLSGLLEPAKVANYRAPSSISQGLKVTANRDYFPSTWSFYLRRIDRPGKYTIPKEVIVVNGNSGKGWATLQVAKRKFCYQGNGNTTGNKGDKFILLKEKTNPTSPCNSSMNDTRFSRSVSLSRRDQVKFSILGGACGTFCTFTEAQAVLAMK